MTCSSRFNRHNPSAIPTRSAVRHARLGPQQYTPSMDAWITLFPIFVSTALGAGVAFASDRLAGRRKEKLAEETAINSLMLDLAAKRALALNPNSRWAPGAAERIVDSVNHMRGIVREARMSLRPRSRYLPPLRDMARACNTFLEEAEFVDNIPTPEHLGNLAKAMRVSAAALHDMNPHHIVGDLPGSYALAHHVGQDAQMRLRETE